MPPGGLGVLVLLAPQVREDSALEIAVFGAPGASCLRTGAWCMVIHATSPSVYRLLDAQYW